MGSFATFDHHVALCPRSLLITLQPTDPSLLSEVFGLVFQRCYACFFFWFFCSTVKQLSHHFSTVLRMCSFLFSQSQIAVFYFGPVSCPALGSNVGIHNSLLCVVYNICSVTLCLSVLSCLKLGG